MADMTTMEFVVQPELLPEVAKRCNAKPGPLSMIPNGSLEGQAPAGADQMLSVEGLIDDKGRVLDKYCKEIATLADPRSRFQIYVIQGHAVLDFTSIRGENGLRISCTVTDRGMVFRDPADDTPIVQWLEGVLGNSEYIQIPFAITIPAGEALVLAAALDLQRKDLLVSVAENSVRPAISFNTADIAKELSASVEGATMFVPLARSEMEYEDHPTEREIQTFLSTLATKGHLVSSAPGTYTLSKQFLQFARQLMVFSTVLRVGYAVIDSHHQIKMTGYTAVQAGPTETALIEGDRNTCSIRTLSSRELIELTKILMEHPQWPGRKEEKERKDLICPSCQAPLPEGAKFCRNCGRPVQPPQNA